MVPARQADRGEAMHPISWCFLTILTEEDYACSLEFMYALSELRLAFQTMWKELTDEEKKPYLEEAEDDKERHAAEVKEYEGGRIFPKKGKV
jgi:hypothetical protein